MGNELTNYRAIRTFTEDVPWGGRELGREVGMWFSGFYYFEHGGRRGEEEWELGGEAVIILAGVIKLRPVLILLIIKGKKKVIILPFKTVLFPMRKRGKNT